MIRTSLKRLASVRVPSYYDRFAKPQPPASVSSAESSQLCEQINEAIKTSNSPNFAILNVESNQVRVTNGDLLEVPADWPCKAGDEIKFEHVLTAGSTDFTLVGRPTISSEIVEVIGTCVEKRINETPFVRFRNPRAPRKPALSFKRETRMARNSEKAMTALARWRQLKIDSETSGGRYNGVRKRPFLAEECSDVRSCKRWRREIIQEISQKMAQIQNAGLGEFRLRDLNDEINKLIREKRHWEERIKKLGGPDYISSNKMLDNDGKELQWNRGYKYFGAAKDLPGVKELFEPDPPKPIKKTRAEYMRYVDAHYFGYMDEEDGQVLPHEAEAERKARAEAIENYEMDKELAAMKNDDWDQDIYATEPRNTDLDPVNENFAGLAVGDPSKSKEKKETSEKKPESEKIEEVSSATGEKTFRAAHVPVPTQDEIQAAMLRKKKIELLQTYANETLSSQSVEARILLG